jgi:hypothetical protein
MPEYTFSIILDGDVDSHIDELFEAGCDDATFGAVDGVPYVDFDREAPTFAQALSSAIAAVESVSGITAVRIEPDDLVTATDIAQRLGRSRESVRLLVAGRRGPGNFPAPYSHTKHRNRLWRWADVIDWAADTDEATRRDAQIVAYANASLEMRTREAQLHNYKSDTKLLIEATRSFGIDSSQDDLIVTHEITHKSRRANKV